MRRAGIFRLVVLPRYSPSNPGSRKKEFRSLCERINFNVLVYTPLTPFVDLQHRLSVLNVFIYLLFSFSFHFFFFLSFRKNRNATTFITTNFSLNLIVIVHLRQTFFCIILPAIYLRSIISNDEQAEV